jgi:DNA-binding transcriptional LysR family regulator
MRYSAANMQQLNWDNLRYVLIVANKGSIASAARELGVNRTTVLRRIESFQQTVGCRIFERIPSGYVLTLEAEKIIEAAQEIEGTLFNMQRKIAGGEFRLEGELRVTTTDTLLTALIGPHLASFHRRYPHITVTVGITNSILNLARRDADIAIRPTKSLESPLVGRRVGDVHFFAYASTSYLQTMPEATLSEHHWIGFDSSLQSTEAAKWLEMKADKDKVCLRTDTFVGLKIAAENGMGLALLPHYLGDSSPLLTRVPAPTDELTTGLWLLTHPDLVRSAKVQAFMEHFENALTKNP